MRLSLGCGCRLLPLPWLNLDIAPQNVPAGYKFVQRDLRNGLPFSDNMAELVHCAHSLDHLGINEAIGLLRECRRVMQPGAIARFIVMDLEAILKAYHEGRIDQFAKWQPAEWAGLRSPSLKMSLFLFGSMSRQRNYTGHWWAADFEGMQEIAERAGFSDIKRMEYGRSQSEIMQREALDDYPDHSIYVELKK
jgi:predicted SAM-dependent methyltransferase